MAKVNESNPEYNRSRPGNDRAELQTEGAVEREVRRRLAEQSAAAGLAPGRPSLEVLFMLPPEFVKAYTTLFDRSLKESVTGGGSKDQAVTKPVRGNPRLSPRAKRKIAEGRGAKAQGKRFREHWVIRDEDMFNHKKSVDRRLRRLARDMFVLVGAFDYEQLLCGKCQTDLTPHMELGYKIRFCPRCGQGLVEGSAPGSG